MKPRKQRRRPNGAKPWREVLEDARERGATQAEVAREQGVTRPAVHNQCVKLQISLPPHPGNPAIVTREILEEARKAGVPGSKVADALGVSRPAVTQAAKKYGIRLCRAQPRGR